MKRIITCLLALAMLFSLFSPIAASEQPTSEKAGSSLGFSEENSLGALLNEAMEDEGSLDDGLDALIQSVHMEEKTATVSVMVPQPAILVVGIFDETTDAMLGCGVLNVDTGEEVREIALEIEIDAMPEFYRGKVFLLDRETNAPLSQVYCHEKTTRGYHEIAVARATDFPAEQVMNLDGNIETNFVVFHGDVLSVDMDQVTDQGNGSYTISNAPDAVRAMGEGDVLAAIHEDGSLLVVKAASVSVRGSSVEIRGASDLEAEDVFQMIKLDIDSEEYGLAEGCASGSRNVPGTYLADGEGTRADDPLHTTTWDVADGTLQMKRGDKDLPALGIAPTVTFQYYRSPGYGYYMGRIDYEITLEIDLSADEKEENKGGDDNKDDGEKVLFEWEPEISVPTPYPGVTIEGVAKIGLELELGASYNLKLAGSAGKEYFAGSGRWHEIRTAPRFFNEVEVQGSVALVFGMGVGVAFCDELVEFSLMGVAKLEGTASCVLSDDDREKIHICNVCIGIELSVGLAVEAELTLLFRELSLEMEILTKPVGKAHLCLEHHWPDSPYTGLGDLGPGMHFGWSECERYAYPVMLQVMDKERNPISNVTVRLFRESGEIAQAYAGVWRYLGPEEMVTDNGGVLNCYLESGSYIAAVGSSKIPFTVSEESNEIILIGDAVSPEIDRKEFRIHMNSRVAVGRNTPVRVTLGDEDVTERVEWNIENLSVAALDLGDEVTVSGIQIGTTQMTASMIADGQAYRVDQEIQVYEIIDEGTYYSMKWEFSSDYVLTISGEGGVSRSPWSAYNPRIEKIIIQEGITSIGGKIFEECVMLTCVQLPDSLKRIESQPFMGCISLEQITLPENLSEISGGAFRGCINLVSIDVDPDNPYFRIVDGFVLSKDGTKLLAAAQGAASVVHVPEGVTTIADSCFAGARITRLELPNSVAHIGSSAFLECELLESVTVYGSGYAAPITTGQSGFGIASFKACTSLKSVEFPSAMNAILGSAFRDCSQLERIEIPDHITYMDQAAFQVCESLKYVKLPKNLERLPAYTFEFCTELEEVVWPEELVYIGNQSFKKCTMLAEIVLPDSVTEIGQNAFYDCTGLSSIIFSKNLKKIGMNVFWGCESLTQVAFPDGLEFIGNFAFVDSGLISVVVPDSVTYLGSLAFQNTPLQDVTLGTGISEINMQTFARCEELTTLTIRGTLNKIGNLAFSGCNQLTDIYYGGSDWTAVEISDVAAQGNLENANIHYISRAVLTSAFSQRGAGEVSVTYTGLVPGRAYVLLMLREDGATITPDNLVYINQASASPEGTLSFSFTIGVSLDGARLCLIGADGTEHIEEKILIGDTNSDGKVNALDLVRLRQHLAGWDVTVAPGSADCNGDGKVSALDLILLRQHLAGWNVTLGR